LEPPALLVVFRIQKSFDPQRIDPAKKTPFKNSWKRGLGGETFL
jgi:hypothetical protein